MNSPKISIIVPNYNYAQYIESALDSLVKQTYTNFEVCIVDDCSTDLSVERILPYIEKDKRFFLIQNQVNSGCCFSLSVGLEKTNGDYVFTFASDDLVLPHFLEKNVQAIKSNPETGLFCSRYTRFYSDKPNEKIINPKHLSYKEMNMNKSALIEQIKRNQFFIPGNTAVIKREFLSKFNNFEEKYGIYIDWFTYHRIGFTYGCHFIPEDLALMRLHRNSLSTTENLEEKKKAWAHILKELWNFKNRSLKKAFIQSRLFNTLGTPFFEFVITNPKYWLFFKFYAHRHFYRRWKKVHKQDTLKAQNQFSD